MTNCPKCGEHMEGGSIANLIGQEPGIRFVIPDPDPVPSNPIEAFKQGLRGQRTGTRIYNVAATRCSSCGYLELYARE